MTVKELAVTVRGKRYGIAVAWRESTSINKRVGFGWMKSRERDYASYWLDLHRLAFEVFAIRKRPIMTEAAK